MIRSQAFARWKYLVAFAALTLTCVVEAQPQDPGPDIDPPLRVARLSYLNGPVSFSPAGNDDWVEARVNRPIVTGDRLWADNGARAELAIDNSTWWIGDATSLAVSNLDDRIVQVQVQEGTLEVRVRSLQQNTIVEIDTPNLAFSITRPGRYRVEVDAQDGSTLVAARDGGGEVYGESASYVITPGQAYRFYGTDVRDSEFVSLPPRDDFDGFVRDRDRRYTSSASLRYVSAETIGYEDLDRYGTWSVESTYGNVWFPRVTRTAWAPYREGHWAWIDPWGWTWVDDEPWGFAPFHYGRWAHFDRGWGWVPGPRHVRPVYAPALVAFVGGAGFSLSVSSGPAIGWFPLAPREVYVPPYHVTRNYFRQVNVSNTVVNVTNVTNIYNNPSRVSQLTYANRRAPNAVTAVPPAAFAQAQSVTRAAIKLPAGAVQRAEVHPVAPVAPARPAFLGAAPAAQAKPPATAMRRPVVAKAPPPPPPIPDIQKVQALEKNPGRPLSRADVQTLRRAAPPAAAPVRPPVNVISQPKPAPNAAPPAREAGARRAPEATPPGQAQRPGAPTAALPGQGQPQGAAVAVPPGQAQRPGAPVATPPGQAGRATPGAAPAAAPPPAERPGARPPEAAPKGPPAARPPEARGPAGRPAPAAERNAAEPPPTAGERREPPPAARGPSGPAERAAPGGTVRSPEAGVRPGGGPPREVAPPPQGNAAPPAPRGEPGRPEAGPPGQAARPPAARRQAPAPSPGPEERAAPEPRAAAQRPPEARAQPQRPPEARPQPQRPPEARPQSQQARPPEARPQPQQSRPPEARPQPQSQASRPQPQRPPGAGPAPQPPQAQRPGPRGGPPDKDEKGKGNDRND